MQDAILHHVLGHVAATRPLAAEDVGLNVRPDFALGLVRQRRLESLEDLHRTICRAQHRQGKAHGHAPLLGPDRVGPSNTRSQEGELPVLAARGVELKLFLEAFEARRSTIPLRHVLVDVGAALTAKGSSAGRSRCLCPRCAPSTATAS